MKINFNKVLNLDSSFKFCLKDMKELGILKITIFLESSTDKLSAFPNEEGYYCFDVAQG